jgi:hypothetical protein
VLLFVGILVDWEIGGLVDWVNGWLGDEQTIG